MLNRIKSSIFRGMAAVVAAVALFVSFSAAAGAQNRSNQMKGYALLWKQVRVLEKLTIY